MTSWMADGKRSRIADILQGTRSDKLDGIILLWRKQQLHHPVRQNHLVSYVYVVHILEYAASFITSTIFHMPSVVSESCIFSVH